MSKCYLSVRTVRLNNIVAEDVEQSLLMKQATYMDRREIVTIIGTECLI